MNTGRYLITTADERTWKFDRPVLFLGEWCRLYDRKHIWEGMDALVAQPYGVQDQQKEGDLIYVQVLTSQLLVELTDALNAFHRTSHSRRYWQIVLGRWVKRYVETAFNRYRVLEQTLANHAVSGTLIFESSDYHLATADSQAFIWAANDDVWNHFFCASILAFFGTIERESDDVTLRGVHGFTLAPPLARSRIKRHVRNVASVLLRTLSRRRDALIISSYLPLLCEAKLQLSLGQCPQLWRTPTLAGVTVNRDQRRRFGLEGEHHTGFERFVRTQLSNVIPTCYLEGYHQLIEQGRSLPWPSEPRFIFTSNQFDTDEIFKVWTGSMVERGVPYFTGQHGNNYGTLRGCASWPELVTCDKFFTWGWTNGESRNVPAFVFKTAGRASEHSAPHGGLLLIEVMLPHRSTPWDNYFEFGIYQEEQFRFVEALPAQIREQLMVRLHRGHNMLRWFEEQRWKDRSPRTSIEPGTAKIQDLIARSRLVVHSYDSTGILETLALNIPTLCFWHGGLSHLLPNAKPYYEQLREAGILLDTPEQAADMVALHWNDVHAWWHGDTVQQARHAFCECYARTTPAPIRTLKHLLTVHEQKA